MTPFYFSAVFSLQGLSLGLQWLLAALAVVILFGLAIFVHEFGHFVAAKLLGFRVNSFALGFGPALWRKRYGETEYRINILPFGGYVALPQLDPSGMDVLQGDEEDARKALPDAAPWKRIIVSVAGPAGNVVLAIIIAWVIWLAPGAVTGVVSTEIGEVVKGTPAWEAGLRSGDIIEQVGPRRVTTWSDFMVECHLLANDADMIDLAVRTPGSTPRAVNVPVTNLLGGVRGVYGIYWLGKCQISGVDPTMPAAGAGIEPGDIIVEFDNEPVRNSQDFVMRMRAAGERPVLLGITRKGRPLSLNVTPSLSGEGYSVIGVSVQDAADAAMWMQYRDPWRQLNNDATQVFRVLQAMVAPKVEGERGRVAKSIGGPVIIIAYMWRIVQESVFSAMGFMRMICINLAIINLLPLPVLDGGHIMFALWELVTRRKPHPRVINALVTAFAVLLIGLMLLLSFKDVRLLSHRLARERSENVTK